MNKINVLVALKAEAIPIIDSFGLKEKKGIFPRFESDVLRVMISGVGKISMAASCGFLLSLIEDPKKEGFINIGLAGHRDLDSGTPLLAAKMIDGDTMKSHFPSIPFSPPAQLKEICTVNVPEVSFSNNYVFDMEAFSFFSVLMRFSHIEMIHILKIISDNQKNAFDKKIASQLIAQNLPCLKTLMDEINTLLKALDDKIYTDLNAFWERWHFTQALQEQFIHEVRRWEARFPKKSLTPKDFSSHSAQETLFLLRKKLHENPLSIH